MSNKNTTPTLATIPAYEVTRQQPNDANWKLPNLDLPLWFTQERQRILGGPLIPVFESVPLLKGQELEIATLSDMMDDDALLNFTHLVKAGEAKATALLMKAWLSRATLGAMADVFVNSKAPVIRLTDRLEGNTDFAQITATFKHYGKDVIFFNRPVVLNNNSLGEGSSSELINRLLQEHRTRLSTMRIFLSRHESSYVHGYIGAGVTRMLSVPTTAGAQAAIEYGIRCNLRPDTMVNELLFG
jgi:hypothetical protein